MRPPSGIDENRASDAAATLVILTRVEGLLCDEVGGPAHVPRDALRILAACGVPLVFVTDASAQDVIEFQRELRLRAPFICERGAALHLPPDQPADPVSDEGEVFRFVPPDVTTAVTCLRGLLTARRRTDVLMVGLGCDHRDCDLLAAVDIPIVVREQSGDQASLLRRFPDAYVTRATGIDGWSEALLGSPLQ
jgi:predicted mannosyl-3-phosphoglycerate phosphatase (HAD superfamily)